VSPRRGRSNARTRSPLPSRPATGWARSVTPRCREPPGATRCDRAQVDGRQAGRSVTAVPTDPHGVEPAPQVSPADGAAALGSVDTGPPVTGQRQPREHVHGSLVPGWAERPSTTAGRAGSTPSPSPSPRARVSGRGWRTRCGRGRRSGGERRPRRLATPPHADVLLDRGQPSVAPSAVIRLLRASPACQRMNATVSPSRRPMHTILPGVPWPRYSVRAMLASTRAKGEQGRC